MKTTATKVPHEITLFALMRWADGAFSLLDIVETSRKNASIFTRRWMRDPEVAAIAAIAPGEFYGDAKRRVVRRAGSLLDRAENVL
ncbi:hypothetical protein [Mesorhizobium sp. M0058]|uniref:hypothetical protein n=1 Tax=Mesorhizobium sp. M0058 TaxID=2956865 RepID=UPI00333B9F86